MPKYNGLAGERWLFMRRWLASPLRVGAVLPSAAALAQSVADNIPDCGDRFIIEIGAGTGAVTAALAKHVPQNRLVLVEIDGELCRWLRKRFPQAIVLHGDVVGLGRLLAGTLGHERAAVIISGIPLLQFSLSTQRSIVNQCFAATVPNGYLLQYSFFPVSPLRHKALGLDASRLTVSFENIPPLFLWKYEKPHTASGRGAAPAR